MRYIIFQKWLWIIILALTLISVLPFIIIYVILFSPPPYNAIIVFSILACWGVVAGYKEWVLFKKNEQSKKKF
jgi:hypothetical protein